MKTLSVGFALVILAGQVACGSPDPSAVESAPEGAATTAADVKLTAFETRRLAVGTAYPACEDAGRYQVEGDVVIDTQNQSRLWQRDVDSTLRSQSDAEAYCATLTLGGRTGWRLPVVQELQSIRLRPSGLQGGPQYCNPSIDQTAFPNTPAAEFWSATTRDAGDGVTTEGMYTEFDDGRTHPSDPGTPMYARCVHDGLIE